MKRYKKFTGQVLKKFRTKAGLSQMKLGELIGVSYQQIQKYESGKSSISAERLIQISKALGVNPSEFFPSGGQMVSEEEEPYQILSKEEKLLIDLFRKIKDKEIRKAVIKIIEEISQ